MLKARSARANLVWNVVKYVLAIALVWFVYSKTSLKDVAALLQRVSFVWLFVSFVLFFLMTMVKSAQYYLLFGRRTPYPRVLSIVVLQNLIASFIATGAGIASYLTMFRMDENVQLSRSAATFILAKVGDLVVVWFMMLIGSIFVWNASGSLRIPSIILLIAIPLIVGAIIGVVVLRQRFLDAIRRLVRALHLDGIPLVERGLALLRYLLEQDLHEVLRLLAVSVACSIIYMALAVTWGYANLRTFSIVIPAAVIVFVNSWIQLISWLPIQVLGGLGVMETSQVYLYGLFGVPAQQMATVSIGLRASTYLFNLASLLYLPLNAIFRSGGAIASQPDNGLK